MEQPKFLDPFLLAKDINAREKELKQAAVAAFGTAKLSKEKGLNNHSGGDDKELLIPARPSPPSNAKRNGGGFLSWRRGPAAP